MTTTKTPAKGPRFTPRSGLAPYTRKSDDTSFNVRRKSAIYRKRIKRLVQLYKSVAGVHGKLDSDRLSSLHFFADTMTFDSDRRSRAG